MCNQLRRHFPVSVPVFLCTALLLLAGCRQARWIDPLASVDPMVGTCCSPDFPLLYGRPDDPPHGNFRCTPCAVTPFGMTQVGPVTRHHGDTPPGYDAHDTTITGFPFMRTSGSGWSAEFGNLLTMPTNGPLVTAFGLDDGSVRGFSSRFRKETEEASPGYYSVRLEDYGIRTECTASPHGGVLRFTYPRADTSRFLCDLAFRITGSSDWQEIEVLDANHFQGHMHYTPKTGGWGNGQAGIRYDLYFYAEVDKPLDQYGFWDAAVPPDAARLDEDVNSAAYMNLLSQARIIRGKSAWKGTCTGFFSEFPTSEGERVQLKAAFSFVDPRGARNNFEAELAGRDFDDIHREARRRWAGHLGKIRIRGGSPKERTLFYTSLYHSMADPRTYSDVDGRFPGGDGRIHTSTGYTRRTLFSGWDVFRSLTPLHGFIMPDLVQDLINSQIALAEESGTGCFNRWELLNAYTGCMIGNPTISVIADAWHKGIRGFDLDKALQYSVRSSEVWGNDPVLGYSADGFGVSNTLEHAYFDWCIARLAEAAGDEATRARFEEKAHAWRKVFNPDLGWFQPRDAEGNWVPVPERGLFGSGTGLYSLMYGCCESNLMQQGWFVPHEFDAFTQAAGGPDVLVAKLDELFARTPFRLGWTEYYHHGNEPGHWVPFLYNKLGEPWKTQQWCRTILEKDYYCDAEGSTGNDDEGQMSAWYVLVAAGIHPSCPGDGRMEILSPLFDRISITLDPRFYNGKTFTIRTHGASPANRYVQKARLNGKPLRQCYFDESVITDGGKLELWMGPEPGEDWGR